MQLNEALTVVAKPADARYLAACKLLVTSVLELDTPVFVQVPDSNDPEWKPVVNGSLPLCYCQKRRLILPAQLRTDFVASNKPVEVNQKEDLLLTFWGGDQAASLYHFEITAVGLRAIARPFPLDGHGRAIIQGYNIARFSFKDLQEAVELTGGQQFVIHIANRPLVVAEITAADSAKRVVTIMPAQGIQVLATKTRLHQC